MNLSYFRIISNFTHCILCVQNTFYFYEDVVTYSNSVNKIKISQTDFCFELVSINWSI